MLSSFGLAVWVLHGSGLGVTLGPSPLLWTCMVTIAAPKLSLLALVLRPLLVRLLSPSATGSSSFAEQPPLAVSWHFIPRYVSLCFIFG